ncbi:hypothetical protein STEG23_012895 [Scotinomys teguina]
MEHLESQDQEERADTIKEPEEEPDQDSSTSEEEEEGQREKMKILARIRLVDILLAVVVGTMAGFDQPLILTPPANTRTLYSPPCDCREGLDLESPPRLY